VSWGAIKAVGVGVVSGTAVAAVIIATAPWAAAKGAYQSPYGYERTWNAALRLVRVDNGWKVTEKDETSGYLLFEYRSPENAKPTGATLEVVRANEADAPVSVFLQVPQMPHYHEQVVLDALAAKMRHEYGDPPRRQAPPETPKEAPDAGEQSD
jgi:hypothetical protein